MEVGGDGGRRDSFFEGLKAFSFFLLSGGSGWKRLIDGDGRGGVELAGGGSNIPSVKRRSLAPKVIDGFEGLRIDSLPPSLLLRIRWFFYCGIRYKGRGKERNGLGCRTIVHTRKEIFLPVIAKGAVTKPIYRNTICFFTSHFESSFRQQGIPPSH